MALPRTSQDEHHRLIELAVERGLRNPPRRPDPLECCNKGCGLCVWDDYEIRLRRWRAEAGVVPAENDPDA